MKVLITGTSRGIGRATALLFLSRGHHVIGIDRDPSSIDHPEYEHYVADIKNPSSFPELEGNEILINNAGTQNEDDIDNNLKGTMNVTEHYAFHKGIKAVLFNASASASSGDEFPIYVASKAGIVGYMKNVAKRLVEFGAIANSISFGGVLTASNDPVMKDPKAWEAIMEATPLKKWMSEEEAAEWMYFLTVTNRSMSGEDILVDNGEKSLHSTFVWPK